MISKDVAEGIDSGCSNTSSLTLDTRGVSFLSSHDGLGFLPIICSVSFKQKLWGQQEPDIELISLELRIFSLVPMVTKVRFPW